MKIETKTIYHVDSNDFDSFVREVYGINYMFGSDENADNYSSYEFSVDGHPGVELESDIEEFKAGKIKQFMAQALLDDMANQNLIPTGDYVISVFW